jgi:hypothetical protein
MFLHDILFPNEKTIQNSYKNQRKTLSINLDKKIIKKGYIDFHKIDQLLSEYYKDNKTEYSKILRLHSNYPRNVLIVLNNTANDEIEKIKELKKFLIFIDKKIDETK